MTHSFYMQACRLYNIPSFLYGLAAKCNLEIDIKKDGLFMIDYFVTLKGSAENIKAFQDYVHETFDRINKMD